MCQPVYPGLFTPQADVLCYKCHGPKWRTPEPRSDIPEYGMLCIPFVSMPDTLRVTWCDSCGCQIGLRDDVAMLNNLRMELPLGWYPRLDQTGGMCVALSMEISNVLYMIYAEDEKPDHVSISMFPNPDESESIHVGTIEVHTERLILALVHHRFKSGARVR